MSAALKNQEETTSTENTESVELVSTTTIEGEKASIVYDKESYQNYIGKELKEAFDAIAKKTDEYFNVVIKDSTSKTKEILDNSTEVKLIQVEAPIYRDGDKLEVLTLREEVENDETPLETLNVKMTHNIGKPINLQSAAALLRKKQ